MRTLFLLPFLFVSGAALAGASQPVVGAAVAACGDLMTEAECRQHRQTLAHLQDPEARRVYLESFTAMLREREVMCGSHGKQQVLARAQYR